MTSPTKWTKIQEIIANISRDTTQELKRKKSTIKIDQVFQGPHLLKRQNTREGSRGPPPTSPNLSKYQVTHGETLLLSKGLIFIPTPHKKHPAKHLQDILLFVQN